MTKAEGRRTAKDDKAESASNGNGLSSGSSPGAGESGGPVAVATRATRVAGQVAQDVAGEVARQLPAGMEASGEAVRTALRDLEGRSQAQLKTGAAFSLGVAAGLLLGGGPRLLAIAAGLPGVVMILLLADRSGGRRDREAGAA